MESRRPRPGRKLWEASGRHLWGLWPKLAGRSQTQLFFLLCTQLDVMQPPLQLGGVCNWALAAGPCDVCATPRPGPPKLLHAPPCSVLLLLV